MIVSKSKFDHLIKLTDKNGCIAALAIDQRGSMEKMMSKKRLEFNNIKDISRFKYLVSKELTKYTSSILLDPIYGNEAIDVRDEESGLIISYEVTGYSNNEVGRLPKLIEDMSGLKIKSMGANAIKILLYYDIDESDKINDKKKAFVERVGYECEGLGLPFFLEILAYDQNITDKRNYAKLRPKKVIEAMKVFNDPKYKVDIFKVETPVDMNFVEGFVDNYIFTKEEASKYFFEQSEATDIPFIFLSGGLEINDFLKTLIFAKESKSRFNGVLCGRATWKHCIDEFVESDKKASIWLKTMGRDNVQSLNKVLEHTATSIFDVIKLK